MARRKAVVTASFNVEQFVEWIPIRQPGRSFLIGAKQIAVALERQRHGKADPRANNFAMRKIGRNLQNGTALIAEIVLRLPARLIDQVRISKIRAAKAEINIPVAIKCHSEGIDAMA